MSKNNGSKKTEIQILTEGQTAYANKVFGGIESQHGLGTQFINDMLNEHGVDKDKAKAVRADLYLICANGDFTIAKRSVRVRCTEWFKDKGYSDSNMNNNGADETNVADAEAIEQLAEEAKAEAVGMTEAEAQATAIALQVKGKLMAEFTDNPRQKWSTRAASVLRAMSRNKTLQANLVAGAGEEPEPKGEAEAAEAAEAEAAERVETELAKIEAAQNAGESKPKRKRASRKAVTA